MARFHTVVGLLILAPMVARGGESVVIAHRGASGYVPEHTLEAVAMAHAQGAHYIEQDVVLSKDRVPVVLHDVELDAVTDVARKFSDRKRANGRYYAIDFTLAELKTLDVHERVDPRTGKPALPKRFPPGKGTFRIPTLDEELDLIEGLNASTGRRAGIYPEIKSPSWHREQGYDISPIVLAALARRGYATKDDPCYVQCFDFGEVRRVREELGYKGKLVQLIGGREGRDGTDPTSDDALAALATRVDGIGPALPLVVRASKEGTLVPTDLVRRAHAAKLEVHPYTVRVDALPSGVSAETLYRALFLEAGVDGVFADHPDRAVASLRARVSPAPAHQPPTDATWVSDASVEVEKAVTDRGLGAVQGVVVRSGKVYAYGDVFDAQPRVGVIREYSESLEPTGRVVWLRRGGKPLIVHPTGLTWNDRFGTFLGDTVKSAADPTRSRAVIYRLDWERAWHDGDLDDAVLNVIEDDAAVNGCRPEFVAVAGRTLLATADYGDVRPEIRLYDPEVLLTAGRSSAPGAVIHRVLCGAFNQNLHWDVSSGRLTCVQNVVAGRGWRLEEVDLARALADGRASGPGASVRRLTFPPHDELEGFWALPGGRGLFAAARLRDNLVLGRFRETEPRPSPPETADRAEQAP